MENKGAARDLEMFVTTSRPYDVHVNVTSPAFLLGNGNPVLDTSFTIQAGDIKQILFSNTLRMTGSSKSTKAILVESSDEIVVYGINIEQYSNDGFLGLPLSVLGKEYYAMSWTPAPSGRYSELAIAAVHDNTEVDLTFPVGQGISVSYNGGTYTSTMSVTLNRFDTFQIQSTTDLTGTFINGSNIISVFSGATKTKIGTGGSSDHLVEHLPPVNAWGKSFVTAPIPRQVTTTGDYFRIVASGPNTQVNVTGEPSFILANKGSIKTLDISSTAYTKIDASNGIMVTQYVKSQTSGSDPADPAMMVLPPISQFAADYTFTTPKYSQDGSYTNYFMVVIEKGEISGLRLDDQPVTSSGWTDVPGTDPVISGRNFALPEGKHRMRHIHTHVIFGGYLYGYAQWESYAFPTGMRLAPLNEPCVVSTMVIGDGFDNDCDGRVDEEGCLGNFTGTDEDLDGQVDEDCAIPPPVNGGLTDWVAGSCNVSCGGGTVTNTRSCTNPSPAYDGNPCTGSTVQTVACNAHNCPVHGVWQNWQTWSNCSQECNTGSRTRLRVCTPPQYGGNNCSGSDNETESCKITDCPIDGGWTNWTYTACSESCGNGSKARNRTCTSPSPQFAGLNCTGDSAQIVACKIMECPINGGWTNWTTYTQCSKTCGTGSKSRSRSCTLPAPQHGGSNCTGLAVESPSCLVIECPVDGVWTSWSEYTPCSVECGVGSSSRNRSCTAPSPQHGGDNCAGLSKETVACMPKECPVDGVWTEWGDWTTCSQTCDAGRETRSRSCTPPQHGGLNCTGNSTESRSCLVVNCPVDGVWSEWSPWSGPSVTCGASGVKRRHRTCDNPAPQYGGQTCGTNNTMSEDYDLARCYDPYRDDWINPAVYIIPVILGTPGAILAIYGVSALIKNLVCGAAASSPLV